MAITHRSHVVRIKNPNDNGLTFVDVEVLDAVAIQTAGGDEALFEVMTQGSTEFSSEVYDADIMGGCEERCYDTTAANAVPFVIDNTGDGNQKGYSEASTRKSHMVRLTGMTDPTQFFDAEILDAFVLKGPDGSEMLLNMPVGNSNAAITDNTSSDLGIPATSNTTRACHIVKLFDTPAPGVTDTTKFLLVQMTDAIAFKAPNGMEFLLEVPNNSAPADTIDTTVYSSDPVTSQNNVPPANTDPDPYVFFPPGSAGPFLGAGQMVNQGLLWWIKNVGYTNNVWYWYYPDQQVMDFSYFGTPPEDADPSWSYRGFMLLPDFTVIWILSENNPLVPIAPTGNPSLEAAITAGNPDLYGYYYKSMPNGAGYSPNGYGKIPFDAPPLDPSQFAFFPGNIWQMTGLAQPPLQNPEAPWNAVSNPYTQPTPDDAAQCAQTWATMWNQVSAAANGEIENWQGVTFNSDTRPTTAPAWPFAEPQPWHTNFQSGFFFNFQAGLPVGLFNQGIPLEVLTQATSDYIAIGQLDPTVWNTGVFPPVKWSP